MPGHSSTRVVYAIYKVHALIIKCNVGVKSLHSSLNKMCKYNQLSNFRLNQFIFAQYLQFASVIK